MSEEIVAKKSLGQHWLNDPVTLEAICDAGDVADGDEVLEVGPGTGTLTESLLNRGAHVTAVELDPVLAVTLPSKFSGRKFDLIEGNILEFDFEKMATSYKVVANIPYYLTSNLIRVLSETPNQASKVVILVQKEVAQRVAAAPGDMSLLSVSAQFYWQISLGQIVPAKLFTPPPKVDSQVLIMERRKELIYPKVDHKKFFRLVKAGFAARRKTLLNSLAGGLRTDKQQIEKILAEANISSGLRPQNLSLDDWHRIYEVASTPKTR
ncbi:MAG: 16S rRNA (adenine(1518)-N(6)/adenine(1519)-N(6))-dimethyltransferase RsmA [Patescibacteria group bacterium]